MDYESDTPVVRRRTLLTAVGSTLGLPAIGTTSASKSGPSDGTVDDEPSNLRRCPDATLGPSHGMCESASMEGCADDDQETIELRERAREAIETRYATVGDLIDREFLPYFDVKRPGFTSGWSHWLSPEYIGDDVLLDPDRPESVLVDNESWRPIGIMFIATVDGEPVDRPPAVYPRDGETNGGDENGERNDGDGEANTRTAETSADRCSPWHYHRGLPGRFAWWYYQQVYEREDADRELSIPCRTPCMMHVWTAPHPEGAYAHDAPPKENRRASSANDPGYETDADPDEDELGWEVLPDDVVPDRKPEDLLELW